MDSPGHTAEYCTYTMMDNETKNIVDVQIVNKRETAFNSVRMEKEGCKRSLDFFAEQHKDINISELATDAHTQIRAMMSEYNNHCFFLNLCCIQFLLITHNPPPPPPLK